MLHVLYFYRKNSTRRSAWQAVRGEFLFHQ